MIAMLTAAAEGDEAIEATELALADLTTRGDGSAAFSAGFQIARWLLDYASQETGTPVSDILQKLAIDSAAGRRQRPDGAT
ncbi:hypothetical protein [Actinomadura rugatobispora]|uniref:Uncharacterized protein n=1 Tax=Actinomadura rugatobispora TaxID=1994 RepID=A0ABW0ZR29_9ACTN